MDNAEHCPCGHSWKFHVWVQYNQEVSIEWNPKTPFPVGAIVEYAPRDTTEDHRMKCLVCNHQVPHWDKKDLK